MSKLYTSGYPGICGWHFYSNEEKAKMLQNKILVAIQDERNRQDRKWGVQDHPFALTSSFAIEEYQRLANEAKSNCETRASADILTWRDILLEEVHEAFAEVDIDKQIEELVQVAAVAVAAIECLERKNARSKAKSRS